MRPVLSSRRSFKLEEDEEESLALSICLFPGALERRKGGSGHGAVGGRFVAG